MTAFITRYCKRFSSGLLVCWLLAAQTVLAAGIAVERAELIPVEEAYQLSADFNIEFSSEVEEAVNKGVALNFLVEFALMELRTYWFDEEIASSSQIIRLSYHALSRQYLINTGSHQMTYATLQEAVQALGSVHDWPVVEKSQLKKGVPYYAMLRMRLDHSRLPKPLQISALGSEKWNLISDRFRWSPWVDKSGGADKPVVDRSISDK
jgi:hypothetical protein